MALISLILILMVVFGLLLLGQNKKYRSCGTGESYKEYNLQSAGHYHRINTDIVRGLTSYILL